MVQTQQLRTTGRIALLALTASWFAVASTHAMPINGVYFDRADGCDSHGPLTFADELGDFAVFPIDESIDVLTTPASPGVTQFACNGDDGVMNDWVVVMTNVSGRDWKDLFFVADEGIAFSNFDGDAEDVTMPGRTLAMRIDDTGVNQPLLGGDVNNNGFFDNGETWEFTVENFTGLNTGIGPAFASVGLFSASSSVFLDTISTASIIANPVPEPGAAYLAVLPLSILLWRRRR